VGGIVRWLGATFVGIGLVAAVALVHDAPPLVLALLSIGLLVVPLALARRRPRLASWLAAALLAASPVALLMSVYAADDWLVLSHERCGTGDAALVLLVPVLQAVLALGAEVLWRLRRSLGRAWLTATRLALGAAVLLLAVGGTRYALQGSVDRAAVLARAHAVTLPAAAPGLSTVDDALDVTVRRSCADQTCALTIGPIGAPDVASSLYTAPIVADQPVTLYAFEHWRLVEAHTTHARRPSLRTVFDLQTGRVVDLQVHDVGPWFGPAPNVLVLLLLAAALGVGTLAVPPAGPLVWRRLGALRATEDDTLDEVIAWRSTVLATVVVASLPLWAQAVLGLVF